VKVGVMPELPEVEALRRELEKDLAGRKIKTVEPTSLKTLPRYRTKKAFAELLEGRKVAGLERRGPFLVMRIEGGDAVVFDLGPQASLQRTAARQAVTKSTQIVFTFTQGGQLRLVDPKAASEVWVVPHAELASTPELSGLGIDPLEAAMSWDSFGRLLWQRHAKLKQLLMDRSVIIGIGPMYSDEILFAAGLRYDRDSDKLTEQEIRRLYRAIVETMQDAVKYRTSPAGVAAQKAANAGDPFEDDGGDHYKVWERDGEACRRCRHDIVKMRINGKPTYFCTACQV
jgi:formamidopyrimidine-DNA glycosylase